MGVWLANCPIFVWNIHTRNSYNSHCLLMALITNYLHCAVFNPQDCSKFYILLPDTPLGNIQPHCNWCLKSPHTQMPTTLYSQVLIHTAECTGAMQSEKPCPRFDTAAQDSNQGSLKLSLMLHPLCHCTKSDAPPTVPLHQVWCSTHCATAPSLMLYPLCHCTKSDAPPTVPLHQVWCSTHCATAPSLMLHPLCHCTKSDAPPTVPLHQVWCSTHCATAPSLMLHPLCHCTKSDAPPTVPLHQVWCSTHCATAPSLMLHPLCHCTKSDAPPTVPLHLVWCSTHCATAPLQIHTHLLVIRSVLVHYRWSALFLHGQYRLHVTFLFHRGGGGALTGGAWSTAGHGNWGAG